ncbi:MAG: type II toxin-antitoxin system RelE/ParE family toxin [Acidobacteria bacterium]|nr:type II toxin-antitoxin system RelE/ParE family toxin [Acidobacteriota bacterium]
MVYEADGSAPFANWLLGLRDPRARAAVNARLARVRVGLLGDVKAVGEGVFELRIDFGPGYRVYFGKDGPRVVVLLAGGTKKTQIRDIRLAQRFWKDYQDGDQD